MPRKKLPARTYLRQRAGREPQWTILDGETEIFTGCGAGDERGAQEELARYLAARFRAGASKRDPARIQIPDVLSLYMRDVAPRTAAPKLIGYHAVPLLGFFGGKSLADINGALCRAYAGDRGKQVSLSTARRELDTLQAAINHWHRECPLDAVPRIVKPDRSESRQRYLTRQEAARLLRAARRLGFRHVARFILIGLYTGTRHSAILSLRWYPSAGAGHVDAAKARLYRRGETEAETRKRRPVARIPDRLMAHIRIWAARDLQQGPQTAIVRWRGKPLVKERRAWALTVKAAGLGDDVTPHVLRHTCATWALQTGVGAWDVAGLLGMSLNMLERVYGHHDPDYQTSTAGAFRKAG